MRCTEGTAKIEAKVVSAAVKMVSRPERRSPAVTEAQKRATTLSQGADGSTLSRGPCAQKSRKPKEAKGNRPKQQYRAETPIHPRRYWGPVRSERGACRSGLGRHLHQLRGRANNTYCRQFRGRLRKARQRLGATARDPCGTRVYRSVFCTSHKGARTVRAGVFPDV